MLSSFFVKNFRLFDQIKISPLGRVNLLVGRNNSGKSALLEAIELYASNASSETLRGLINAREETWHAREITEVGVPFDNPVRYIFHGRKLPSPNEDGMVIGPANDTDEQIRLVVAAFGNTTDEQGMPKRSILHGDEISKFVGEIQFVLMAGDGHSFRWVLSLNEDLTRRHFGAPGRATPKCPFQSVPTRNMSRQKAAALWDLVGLTDLSEEVISGLSRIDESIVAIQFVESDSEKSRIPYVRTRTSREPLPLKSMGDGITRLFHILIALVTARDGILLIDEFENGLHWSVQADVWKTIFRVASRLNVQVFATTHSRDCIRGFGEAWVEQQESGRFFRLETAPKGGVRAKAYTVETLIDAIESEVEVR